MVDKKEIESLLGRSENELFILLAQTSPECEDLMFAPAEAEDYGRTSFARLTPRIRQKICFEWEYCSKRHDPNYRDRAVLASGLADVLTGALGGIPVGTVSALLVNMGLENFCGCKDSGRDE